MTPKDWPTEPAIPCGCGRGVTEVGQPEQKADAAADQRRERAGAIRSGGHVTRDTAARLEAAGVILPKDLESAAAKMRAKYARRGPTQGTGLTIDRRPEPESPFGCPLNPTSPPRRVRETAPSMVTVFPEYAVEAVALTTSPDDKRSLVLARYWARLCCPTCKRTGDCGHRDAAADWSYVASIIARVRGGVD